MTVARYELRGPNRLVSERPTILEMLALGRAAQRVVELTEMLLLSLSPVVAGRTGPLRFAVAMVGPSLEEARHVVEQVAAQVQGCCPNRSSSAPPSSRPSPTGRGERSSTEALAVDSPVRPGAVSPPG